MLYVVLNCENPHYFALICVKSIKLLGILRGFPQQKAITTDPQPKTKNFNWLVVATKHTLSTTINKLLMNITKSQLSIFALFC